MRHLIFFFFSKSSKCIFLCFACAFIIKKGTGCIYVTVMPFCSKYSNFSSVYFYDLFCYPVSISIHSARLLSVTSLGGRTGSWLANGLSILMQVPMQQVTDIWFSLSTVHSSSFPPFFFNKYLKQYIINYKPYQILHPLLWPLDDLNKSLHWCQPLKLSPDKRKYTLL